MSFQIPKAIPDLDRIESEDVVVRNLLRTARAGKTTSLDVAVAEMRELGIPGEKIDAAVKRIEEVIREVVYAEHPRAVAARIEGWYPGPRDADISWPPFRDLLSRDGFDVDAVRDVDSSSTKVVAYLPDPHRQEPERAQGLVLGYVQSGKTTSFTAVIAKAADAGYRLFIVLSGIHNALRQQTQDRLNEQLHDLTDERWFRLTNDDDFRPDDNVNTALTSGDKRVLAVVKKNGPRLRALRDWMDGARPEVLAACPVLIIDDEADQATPNTAKRDRDPTVINGLIRQLLQIAPRAAYVGYTATPFANILMDPTAEGSLYPKNFIVDLPRPRNYIGPEAVFGREPLDLDDDDLDDGHDFVRSIDEHELDDLRPKGASTRYEFQASMTPSLEAAIRYFVLSTAARRVRGQGNKHATALVHTSQYSVVHQRTAECLRHYMVGLAQRLESKDSVLMEQLRETWDDECERVPSEELGYEVVSWDLIAPRLAAVASDVEVIVDNSQSSQRLQFERDRPRTIIAVGGNTLSRGLTLEGLAVSYFVRSASAYDTLLQMGRWFGYRAGYADVTRIWMTDTMLEWFRHLATVEQEIRYDIARYEADDLTPESLGVRIRTHPKMAITAASKMRDAIPAEASYSGRRLQTILFNHRDHMWLNNNIAAGRNLIEAAAGAPRVTKSNGSVVIGPVPSAIVAEFLDQYRFHENSVDLKSKLIIRYLNARRREGELTHFKIAVMSSGRSGREHLGHIDLGLEHPVTCISRTRLDKAGGTTYADIKSLMGPQDRGIDLDVDWNLVRDEARDLGKLRNTPDRDGLGDGTGLLLLYPISKDSEPTTERSKKTRLRLDAVEHVLGVGLVFPESSSREAAIAYDTAPNIMALQDGHIEEPGEDDAVTEDELAT